MKPTTRGDSRADHAGHRIVVHTPEEIEAALARENTERPDAAREEPQGEDALCECGHTAHMHSALVATPGGRTQAPQGTGWCEETREDASSCGCEKFRGTEEPPDQGTGKFGDPYMTSDGSDDPNRASAEAEGALLTPEEVEKVKEWPDDAVERVAIYLSGGDLVSWRERADHSQHPGDTDGKDQFRRDARKLLAVLAAREDTERPDEEVEEPCECGHARSSHKGSKGTGFCCRCEDCQFYKEKKTDG